MASRAARPGGIGRWGLALIALAAASCGRPLPRVDVPRRAYVASGDEAFARHAPLFVIQSDAEPHNRIGTPVARRDARGRERVSVDPAKATAYTQTQEFRTARGRYTNLIYRVHFERVPGLHLTTGRNVGLLAIVTLNEAGEPVLLTLVHTCGCFLAVVPTSYLPADAFPKGWDKAGQTIHGERLPGVLLCPRPFDPAYCPVPAYRPVLFLRDGTHRVMDVRMERADEAAWRYAVAPLRLEPMAALDRLPLDGGTTSFFVEDGPRKGFVKDSHKPLERFLIGWWTLDFNVGRDKRFGPREESATTFYTSLDPTRRRATDLWRFAECLANLGWGL